MVQFQLGSMEQRAHRDPDVLHYTVRLRSKESRSSFPIEVTLSARFQRPHQFDHQYRMRDATHRPFC